MQRKLTDQVQLKLRFDERLRRKLERAAGNDRSLNAEIVHRLERSLQDGEILTEICKRLAASEEKLAAMMKLMMERQDERYERFLKEYQENQRADWDEDRRDDPDYREQEK
jgi:hypothetical protein